MKLNVIFASSLLFLLSGCSLLQNNTMSSESNPSDLNAKWKIISIEDKAIDNNVNGKEPLFSFDLIKKEYAAITGCNNLMGGFELHAANKIKFSMGMSTMMACANMEVEQGLSRILPLITSYVINQDTLSFMDKKKSVKVKFILKKEDKSALLNGKWELNYLGLSDKPVNQLFNLRKPTIEFNTTEETLSGNGGCNNYSSTYHIDGHKIKFGTLASTKMSCATIAAEGTYFKNLEKSSSFNIKDDQLTLITNDMAILRFKKIK